MRELCESLRLKVGDCTHMTGWVPSSHHPWLGWHWAPRVTLGTTSQSTVLRPWTAKTPKECRVQTPPNHWCPLCLFRKWPLISRDLDGPRDHHTEWSKSERERQTPYINTPTWELENRYKRSYLKPETDTQMERASVDTKGKRGGGRGLG